MHTPKFTRCGLWRGHDDCTTDLHSLLSDDKATAFKIHVDPTQAAQLATATAGTLRRAVRRPPQRALCSATARRSARTVRATAAAAPTGIPKIAPNRAETSTFASRYPK